MFITSMITLLIPSIIFTLIFPYYVNSKCSSEWTTRVDSDGYTYGYLPVLQDLITIFEASSICKQRGGDVVSIHSDEENNFVGALAAPLIQQCQTTSACQQRVPHTSTATTFLDMLYRSFWIGFSRVQFAHPNDDPSVHCANLDGTQCDYGRYDGLPVPSRDIRPWAFGGPSSLNATTSGEIEGCVLMFINDSIPLWNDVSCYLLLGGVTCKKNCSATCDEESEPTTSTSTTTTAAAVTTQTTEEPDDEPTVETSTTYSCVNDTNICGADGWKWNCYKNDKCYSYHRYAIKGSYWKGLAKCRRHDATVCSIKSEEENDYVSKQYCGCDGKEEWLGMHRMQTDNGDSIVCLDEDDRQCYYEKNKDSKNPWAENSPADAKDMDDGNYGKKNCCIMSNGKWKDVGCTRPISKVVCKKECVKPQ
ncbi:hypothetical protein ACQ4LE_000043 [Meloidogyne hapla]